MKRIILLGSAILLLAAGCNKANSKQQSNSASNQNSTAYTSTITQPAQPATVQPSDDTGSSAATTKTSTQTTPPSSTTDDDQTDTTVGSSLPLLPLGNLGLITDTAAGNSQQINYYAVQGISFNGNSIVDAVDSYCGEDVCAPTYYRFLLSGKTYTLLTNYSADITTGGIDEGVTTTTLSSDMDVPELDIPAFITDPNSGAVLSFDQSSDIEGIFFKASSEQEVFEAQNVDVYSENGGTGETFDVQGPDGKELNFDLDNPFNTNGNNSTELPITWNNGLSHGDSYTFDTLDQCTEGNAYVAEMTNRTIALDELVVVGTDQNGADVYEFKNSSDPALLVAQQQIASLRAAGGTGNDSKRQGDDVIFWRDPFGRMIRYVTTDMLQSCPDTE